MPDPFTQLLEWRRNEAAGRGLSKLPPDYYPSTSGYLGELRRSYEADLRENPSSRKGEISRQTYQRASQVARDILEARVQKVLSLAFQASIGGARELPNALPEERAMFDELLRTLLQQRRASAPYLEPSPALPPPAAAPAAEAKRSSEPAPTARTTAPRPAGPDAGLVYVRILTDAPPISVGTATVDLRADDLLSLPAAAAKLLVETKVAEPLSLVVPTAPAPRPG